MSRKEITVAVRRYNLKHHRDQPRGIAFKRKDNKEHAVRLRLPCDYDLAVEYRKKMPLFLDVPVSFPPGVGMGWALIVDSWGRALYYATPCNKTKNFQENFLWNAHITWKRVANWPSCPKCGVDMEIIERPDHGNFWACYRTKHHVDGKYARMDWNFALTPEEREVKEAEYRTRAKVRAEANKKAKAGGKPAPRKAHGIRIPWQEKHGPLLYPPPV